jgi:hypothetical protein
MFYGLENNANGLNVEWGQSIRKVRFIIFPIIYRPNAFPLHFISIFFELIPETLRQG